MVLIGLVGRAGSGKSTVAEHLVSAHGFRQEAFAAPLKDAAVAIFGWSRADLEGDTPERRAWREKIDVWWAARLRMPELTPRWVLQHLGTEVMRANFHEDIWVAAMQRRLQARGKDDVVVSDVRMLNEAWAIREAGGVLVRVERPGSSAASSHATEALADLLTVDLTLVNDGTLGELLERVSRELPLSSQ